jgi:CheY-like chemotaxis protein
MPESGYPPSARLAGVSVLIVENDLDNLEMFETYLRHCGASVTSALDATAALEAARGQALDVIVTDVSVLRSAEDLLRDLRNLPQHRNTPVIAVTGWTATEVRHLHFTAFMQKPVDLDALCATILSVAGQSGVRMIVERDDFQRRAQEQNERSARLLARSHVLRSSSERCTEAARALRMGLQADTATVRRLAVDLPRLVSARRFDSNRPPVKYSV